MSEAREGTSVHFDPTEGDVKEEQTEPLSPSGTPSSPKGGTMLPPAIVTGQSHMPGAALANSPRSQQRNVETAPPPSPSQPSSTSSSSSSSSVPPYTGLVNLGSTCYLNSLIQSLQYLPYLSSAVHSIPSPASNAMTSALQLLFHTLTAQNESPASHPASTKQLTDAFGWKGEELATQQDLHEMCIKLREKLEEKMKGTDAEHAIKHLFFGVNENIIRTLDGEFESITREGFYEIQLEIKGKKDIQEALREMCKSERLEGANRYKVERDGEEAEYKDADKFVRYRMLPPVLNLHLKRFEIDYYSETLEQKKLYNRFEYPEILDLTEFEQPLDDDDTNNYGELYEKGSPAIYRAHSVIVHSGGPRVGHYYAFIRPELGADRDTKNWVLFDDANVSYASEHSVFEASYGGQTWLNSWGVEQVVPDTAYILMYIRESSIAKVFTSKYGASEAVRESYLRKLQKAEEDDRLRREASKLVFFHLIRENTVGEFVEEQQTGLYVFPATYGGFYLRRSDTIRRLREVIYEATGIPPELQRLWAWPLFEKFRRCDPIWAAPLLCPNDDDASLIEDRWAEILPTNEVVSINMMIEEPRVPIHYCPQYPEDGVDIARLGLSRQSSVYQQQKKGLSHPASNALMRDRTFSQTCMDDVDPSWVLSLPEVPQRIRKIVVKNRVDTVKFIHRFQNLNLSVFEGRMDDAHLVYDYRHEHEGVAFNPRNVLQNPTEWVIDFLEGAPVAGDKIRITKDNSHFPPPPPATGCVQSGASDTYQYQRDYDEDHWGYPACVDKGSWGRNRALAMNLVEVFIDPPPERPPCHLPVLLPYDRDMSALLMLKMYNPQTQQLLFAGSLVVHLHELVRSIEPVCLLLYEKCIPESDRTVFTIPDTPESSECSEPEEDEEDEEEEDEEDTEESSIPPGNSALFFCEVSPKRSFALPSAGQTFQDLAITSGSVITFQMHNKHCQAFDHPIVLSYYEHLADTIRVHFEKVVEGGGQADESYVELELSNNMHCLEITEKLAEKLYEDPECLQLRLCSQWCYAGIPEKRSENRTLREMIKSSTGGNCDGVFFMSYCVLTDMTVEESEAQVQCRVVLAGVGGAVVGCETLTLQTKTSVRTVFEMFKSGEKPFPFAEEDVNEMVLLEIEDYTIKAEYYAAHTFLPDPDCYYELRPLPRVHPDHPEAMQSIVHVVHFTDSSHSWTGRAMAERHSSPMQFRVLPGEVWRSFLERYTLPSLHFS